MVPQTETNNADMYPPLPVGVGTKSKADPAIAPEAIATASGVAVPPPGRQNLKRRAMDAMARDAATEMPKIPPQHLVVGSRVEGLFMVSRDNKSHSAWEAREQANFCFV